LKKKSFNYVLKIDYNASDLAFRIVVGIFSGVRLVMEIVRLFYLKMSYFQVSTFS